MKAQGAPRRKVLFLCTANSARSQMAEGLARHLAADRWDARSAGAFPAGLHPLAVAAMAEIGVDISGQTSKGLEEVGTDFDLVVTLCEEAAAACPVYPGEARVVHLPMEDPAAGGAEAGRLAAFRRVRDRLRRELPGLLREPIASP